MEIPELPPPDRPRERLLRLGPDALREEELLALVLGTGFSGRSALEVARSVLAGKELRELVRLAPAALARLDGFGESRACALAAAIELARRSDSPKEQSPELSSPAQVYSQLRSLRLKQKEHFVALYVNARNRLLHVETVSIGTLTASLVHPREVFGPAIERRAAGVVVAHNHPSGDTRPSAEDCAATRRLERAGSVLGVPLLDHVVVAEGGYYSFREEGGLSP